MAALGPAAPPPAEVDLAGFVDLHVHSAPDVRPRKLDDVEVAQAAAAAGLAGVVLRSHVTCTADRAAVAEKVVRAGGAGVRVCGGVVLNHAVGGLNPAAVEAALGLGAREVWLPTFSARGRSGAPGGLAVWDEAGELRPVVREVLVSVRNGGCIWLACQVGIETSAATTRPSAPARASTSPASPRRSGRSASARRCWRPTWDRWRTRLRSRASGPIWRGCSPAG